MNNHIAWIDWAKTAAIFFVILLHIHCDDVADRVINAFVIPLFFLISGYLFNLKNNPRSKSFVKKRFRQLVIPYLWINVITYLSWLLVLRHYGNNPLDAVEYYVPLFGIVSGIGPLLVHNIPLWSLLSFFVVEMAFYSFVKRGIKWWNVLLISILLYSILITFIPNIIGKLPFVIGPSISGLIFYSLGYGWREDISRNRTLCKSISEKWGAIILFSVSLLVFVFSINRNETISFYDCKTGSLIYFFCSSISGSVLVILASKFVDRYVKTNKIIRLISKGTLIICGLHLSILAFFKGIILLITGIGPDVYTHGIVNGIILALITLMSALPLILIIRKYAMPLVNK